MDEIQTFSPRVKGGERQHEDEIGDMIPEKQQLGRFRACPRHVDHKLHARGGFHA